MIPECAQIAPGGKSYTIRSSVQETRPAATQASPDTPTMTVGTIKEMNASTNRTNVTKVKSRTELRFTVVAIFHPL